jgi:hypothetical protein
MAVRRNTLIKLFIEWKGEKYMPSKIHPAIRWCKTDPFLENQDSVDSGWRVVDSDSKMYTSTNSKSSSVQTVPKNPTSNKESEPEMPVSDANGISGLKRKRDYSVPTKKTQSITTSTKKVKFSHNAADTSASVQLNIPLGTQWHNNSCVYDAMVTILFNMWSDPNPATTSLEDTQCVMFDALIKSFHSHESQRQIESGTPVFSLEQIREFLRRRLARLSQEFTFGSYTSVQSLAEFLFSAQEIVTTSLIFCSEGHDGVNGRNHRSSSSNYQIIILDTTENSLQACMDNFRHQLGSRCVTCNTHLTKYITFVRTPPLLAFDLSSGSTLSLDPVLWILCNNSCIRYNLRGIIYYDNQHFTERVVTSTGMIWFHDGIFTGRSLVYESQELNSITTENAVMAFYLCSP